MKGRDLIKLLEGKEDFDVILRLSKTDNHGMTIKDCNIELCDIGWSDNVISLTTVEEVDFND